MTGHRPIWSARRVLYGFMCLVLLALLPALAFPRPSVAITAPADQATISGQIWVTVAFRSDTSRQIVRVELLMDGQEFQAYVLPVPLHDGQKSFPVDTASFQPGPHQLSVRAFDAAGETGAAAITVNAGAGVGAPAANTIDQIPPVVSVYYPAQGAVVSGLVTIRAEASDQGGVRNLIFYIDGKLHTIRMNAPPYTAQWDTSQYKDGPHVIEARAKDSEENQGISAPVTIIVQNNAPLPAPGTQPVPGGPPGTVPPAGLAGPPVVRGPGATEPAGTWGQPGDTGPPAIVPPGTPVAWVPRADETMAGPSGDAPATFRLESNPGLLAPPSEPRAVKIAEVALQPDAASPPTTGGAEADTELATPPPLQPEAVVPGSDTPRTAVPGVDLTAPAARTPELAVPDLGSGSLATDTGDLADPVVTPSLDVPSGGAVATPTVATPDPGETLITPVAPGTDSDPGAGADTPTSPTSTDTGDAGETPPRTSGASLTRTGREPEEPSTPETTGGDAGETTPAPDTTDTTPEVQPDVTPTPDETTVTPDTPDSAPPAVDAGPPSVAIPAATPDTDASPAEPLLTAPGADATPASGGAVATPELALDDPGTGAGEPVTPTPDPGTATADTPAEPAVEPPPLEDMALASMGPPASRPGNVNVDGGLLIKASELYHEGAVAALPEVSLDEPAAGAATVTPPAHEVVTADVVVDGAPATTEPPPAEPVTDTPEPPAPDETPDAQPTVPDEEPAEPVTPPAEPAEVTSTDSPSTTEPVTSAAVTPATGGAAGPHAGLRRITAARGASATGIAASLTVHRLTVADADRLAGGKMVFDGKVLPDGAVPEVVDGVLMVSLKHLFEAADGAIYWFPEQKLARAITASADLAVQTESPRASLNGDTLMLKAAPVSKGGRLLVPVELVEKALGVTFEFEPVARQVIIRR